MSEDRSFLHRRYVVELRIPNDGEQYVQHDLMFQAEGYGELGVYRWVILGEAVE